MDSEKIALADETTEDLISYIQWREQPEYAGMAKEAFIAFCHRFRDRVQHTCRVIAENQGYDHNTADKIAETVFERFYKYPHYNHQKCRSGDIDKCVELYLYKFAARALSDHIHSLHSPFSGEEIIVTDYPDIENMDAPPERRAQIQKEFEIIKKALDRLSEKHKIIYLTYKQYEFELKGGKHYLPHAFLERLRRFLGISQASVRKYKQEANDKIEEYLNIYGAK